MALKSIRILALLASSSLAPVLFGQSATSGDVAGTITDPAGAVVVGGTVVIENASKGLKQTATTAGNGTYRFPLLPPGQYTVTVTVPGFQSVEQHVEVQIGGALQVDFRLEVQKQSQVVEVSGEAVAVQTENGDIQTVFNTAAIQSLPNPGSDITFYAQLSPGAVMNTGGGYGNFSVFGLPATSNLFTMNGQNDNDPFLNVNNSGATNLLLGANEVAEVSVTTNGYSGQYGQLAGANVNYVTKAGTNSFHGNAKYYWDGRIMNANDFFNNANGNPRQFVNANQWADSVGGPIRKDKTFFFFDNEGLRVVLPTTPSQVRIPSPAFETATLTNLVATGQGAEVPFYNQLFKAYNSATGAAGAQGIPNSCGAASGLAVPSGVCTLEYEASPNAFAHEQLFAVRVDQNFGENDRFYARFQTDHGVQPTYTDPVNPIFNATSVQPEYQGQMNWTHIFGPRATNQLVASATYYNAPFETLNPSATNAVLPYFATLADGSLASLNVPDTFTPQGREINQWQIVDDYSLTFGNQTIKVGGNYHRDLVNDYDLGVNTGGELIFGGIDDLYNGVLGSNGFFTQNFPSQLAQDIRTYQLGVYVEDDVRVTSNFKVTLALRTDHNANPTCPAKCFSDSVLPFTALNHDPTVPYNQAISTNLDQGYYKTNTFVWEPRAGFAWSLTSDGKTVLRGGVGIFGDSFPSFVVDHFLENIPNYNGINLYGSTYATSPVASTLSNGVFGIAAAANASLNSGFSSGGTLASIGAANPTTFAPPSLTTLDPTIKQPRYYEWNMELQRELPWSVLLSVNYVGNHGIDEAIQNTGLNSYCATTCAAASIFGTSPLDSRFSTVTQYQSSGVSNYNGLIISARKSLSAHLQFTLNYAWSHALDEISNGGLSGFTSGSLLSPVDPYNIRAYNYGNADYDVRQSENASYVWDDVIRSLGFHRGPRAIFGDWQLAGTVFHRGGFPFSVTDIAPELANDGGIVLASTTAAGRANCGSSAVLTANGVPCLNINNFISNAGGTYIGFGNQSRNQYTGPSYFDTDMNISKQFTIHEDIKFGIGAEFFNLFNHPNFAPPCSNVATCATGTFGLSASTVNVPTSILGSFLGGDASPRLVQLHGGIVF